MAHESWLQNVSAKGSSYQYLVWYVREILNTSWAFILWSLEIGFHFVFYRTGHKNVLHRHGMIPYEALFHYFLWFKMCTDHIDISSLRGLLLRELLNCLVLLVVTHTGYKNLFFFLLSYMYGEEYLWNRFLKPQKVTQKRGHKCISWILRFWQWYSTWCFFFNFSRKIIFHILGMLYLMSCEFLFWTNRFSY